VAVAHGRENIVPDYPSAKPPPGGASSSDPFPHPPNPGCGTNGPGQTPGANGGGGDKGWFETGTQARRVVYVIDHSASMGPGDLLAAAVRELRASLARLPPTARFQVILYHDQCELLLPEREELFPATPENTARASQLLEKVCAEGGTSHLPALQRALCLGPEVIYLLTDADDLSDTDRQTVTRINRDHVVIHTIELNTSHRDNPHMPLQVLARENGGQYRAVDPRP
jgi:hypothetical protein